MIDPIVASESLLEIERAIHSAYSGVSKVRDHMLAISDFTSDTDTDEVRIYKILCEVAWRLSISEYTLGHISDSLIARP